ncbi:MAG: putative inorganic carbon transporter subunit DabA [Vicinamibacterales bacterium]
MSTFIHHNTLHGLQHLTFEAALAEGERLLGGRGYLRNDEFRALYRAGRITDGDLRAAFEARPNLGTDEALTEIGDHRITAGDVYRAHMLYGVEPIDRDHLLFEIRERDATRRLRDDVPALARAGITERAGADFRRTLDRVGRDWTLSDWVGYHTNLDLAGRVYAEVVRSLGGDSSAIGPGPASASPPGAPSSPSPPAPSTARRLEELEIPRDRWSEYLHCIDQRFREVPAAERGRVHDLWLDVEAGWVRKLSRRHFGVRGAYGAIAAHFNADVEAYTVLSLWNACLASYALEDPLSPTDPRHFQEQEADGLAERMHEQFRHMERWGGPPIPLDAELHADVQRLVETEVARLRERADSLDQASAGSGGGEAPALEVAHLCWFVLHDLGANELNRRGLGALEALVSLRPGEDESERTALLTRLYERDPRREMREHAEAEFLRELGELGRTRSHADVLRDLTGEDVNERVNAYMVRRCAAFLDEGQAAWRMPGRALGFYDAWRSLAASERIFDLEGLPGWRNALYHLPALAEDAVIEHLHTLGVHHDHWGGYLRRLLVQLPGWMGMINWRARRPRYPRQQVQGIDLVQYLAVRLFYETLIVKNICRRTWQLDGSADALQRHFEKSPSELVVRRELFRGGLPDHVAERARALVDKRFDAAGAADAWETVADEIWACRESGPTIGRSAWRLFHLAQLLGLSGDDIRALSAAARDRLIGALDSFPGSSHGPIWLAAYERHYRDQVLNALANNRGKGRWRTRPTRPKAQVIFCIDEREEAIHRHFEELDPGYETLGAAGFFGVAINYSGLGSHDTVPLCPPVIVPGHRVEEVPRPTAVDRAHTHLRRAKWHETLHNTYWEVKRNAISAYFLIDLIGFVQAVPLLGRILTPLRYAELVDRLRRRAIPPVSTMLTLSSDDEAIGPHAPAVKRGFTLDEQTDRIEATLRNTGLTYGFAHFVVVCGHGSSSLNNPHESAHDCGACGGKHGGPNGRAFAGMANRPAVRAKLRERGIDIPDDTWFVGAQHNTCSELMTYFDTEVIPATLRDKWRSLVADLDEARARSAQERCRRFASAPKDASPRRSLRHIESRANNLSQVRPEWGHATNACALVGRRSATQGLFLDRRVFVISYDPSQDPSGMILERILLAVGPVGAGINLEYYFSTVDNQRWGSDTKVPHNVCGLIGVMEGAMSDLRTGLPKQMVEVHEAMRLQLIVEASNDVLGGIYGRQAAIRELLDNQWVHLIGMDPDGGEFSLFVPGKGFVRWDEPLVPLPVVQSSFEWYRGQTDFLGPALIVDDRGDQRRAKHAGMARV